ncbi:arginine--tRNA ligase [Streptomyces sp. PKU-EA00015]|uniref:ArgS-related anticodon-binding protein NrtL n=1 Tax=Streptomyces sp. PKU-EA00015 TaxID=2748326 RepID=UPI0015A381AF|nr:DALR anticodon-binding domain-containing protein [Streptomyces sp. PKU-EA00015]NWF25031.1 arginine--tRNA ligase [Streptomyces sp. PKU-EA00015]
MTPAELSRTVLHAVCRAVEDGVLRAPVPESVRIERPRPGGRGDYATNVALRLAGPAGQPAGDVAVLLRERIGRTGGIERIEITGPGFLNFTLAGSAQQRLLVTVREQGERYGMPGSADKPHSAGLPDGPGPAAFPHADELRARVWAETLLRLGARPLDGETVTVVPAPHGDLPESLGSDAVRWALLAAAAHDRPRTEGLLVQHERSPLYRVRYAHARARALSRSAAALGFGAAPDAYVDAPALTTAVADHPAVVADAARLRAPDRLARHLDVTADALLAFQHTVLPVGDEKPSAAHRSRLALAEAAGTVLAGGLSLLGISAPEYL